MNAKPYPKYKPSGVEWLGDVPEHWEVGTLKSIVSTPITDGPHSTPEILIEGIPFVSAEAIRDQKINFKRIRGFISEEDHAIFSRKYRPQLGYIFMVKSGATTGRVAMVLDNRDFNIWSPLAAIRCAESKVQPRFLFFYLQSKEFQTGVELSWSFGTQQNIGMGVIGNLKAPLPSIPEQQAIADFLDERTGKLDGLLGKKRELIRKLKEKRSALISRTVTKGLPPEAAAKAGLTPNPKLKPSGIPWLGDVPEHWEIKKLSYLTRMQSGDTITSLEFSDDGNYPVFGGNGHRGYYSEFTHDGDFVLIGRQGALCGNINYASGRFWASEHAIVVRPIFALASFWFGELLRVMNLNQYSVSAAQPGVSVEAIKALKVPFPTYTEQNAIADFLKKETAKLDRMTQKVETAIEKLTEYRTALITAAVTGKIDVRVS